MDFGVYLQCHKNPYATYKCLESLRLFYPNCTVVLLSDNGHDYSELAIHFNCIYIHENENIWLTFRDLDSGNHFDNSYKLINRIYNSFQLCKEDYVMWLEDDVSINSKITDIFRYDLNGYSPNVLKQIKTIKSSNNIFDFLDENKEYRFTGHGGSVFNKNNFINYLNNKDIINNILTNWKKYDFPTTLGQDFLFSMIIILNKGSIGTYIGHYDFPHYLHSQIIVQHQFKQYYGIEIPEEIKHLVKIT
jgi:hypothetical protein